MINMLFKLYLDEEIRYSGNGAFDKVDVCVCSRVCVFVAILKTNKALNHSTG